MKPLEIVSTTNSLTALSSFPFEKCHCVWGDNWRAVSTRGQAKCHVTHTLPSNTLCGHGFLSSLLLWLLLLGRTSQTMEVSPVPRCRGGTVSSPAAPRLAPPRQAGVEPGRMLLAPKPALNVGWEQQVLY